MPDRIFSDPRLAEIYDIVDSDRSDLDHYMAMTDEFAVRSVLDIGCGTGTFACLLAAKGMDITGVDPAKASLDVARAKPGASGVCWVLGDASDLPQLSVDLATMTGNVAQVFLEDVEWTATLLGIGSALRPGGRLVFEVRDPAQQAWRGWNYDDTFARVDLGVGGSVETWVELVDVSLPLVTFRSMYCFEGDEKLVVSESTLRFREREEVEASLSATGFRVDEVRDAPDRPSKEFVFVAGRAR
ncbi:MAG: class I SAM-dependent methyltransferase [Acidimicrobiales bacterium]